MLTDVGEEPAIELADTLVLRASVTGLPRRQVGSDELDGPGLLGLHSSGLPHRERIGVRARGTDAGWRFKRTLTGGGAQDSANRPSDPRPWLLVTRGARPVGLGREVPRPADPPAWSPRGPVGEGRAPTARLLRPIAEPAGSQMPAETSWNLVRVMRSTEPSGMVTS